MNSKVQISFKEKQGFDDKKPNWNVLRTNKHIPQPTSACEVRRTEKCSFISTFALIYFERLSQIASLFYLHTFAVESHHQRHFLVAKTAAKTVKTISTRFLAWWGQYIADAKTSIQRNINEPHAFAGRYDL